MTKHVVITGAAGFLGRAVVNAALACPDIAHVIACDIAPLDMTHSKLTAVKAKLTAAIVYHAIGGADAVIHLAATLGGAAELDPTGARDINLDATLDLMDACVPSTRFVFASSIAVLGDTPDSRAPMMVYGGHKAMVEIALETATRRGEIDGISLRPAGIVARAGNGTGLKSAFLSEMFWAMREGRDITLPVSEDGETSISSVGNVAANFIFAATTPELGPIRSLNLPMTSVRFGDLMQALKSAFPDSQSNITYDPDPDIMRLFTHSNLPDTQDGLAAGFTPDASLADLIEGALKHGEIP